MMHYNIILMTLVLYEIYLKSPTIMKIYYVNVI